MKKRILGLLFLLICCTNYLAAQVDTEFWFAAPYFNCEHGMYAPYRLVIFSFDEEATITVSMPANPAFTPIVRTIGANSYTEIVLANDKLEGDASITTPFNTITQRGLLITSTGKIECYYQVDGDNSEAYTLKGKNALGTDFLVVGQKTYDNGTTGAYIGSRFSIHIVASEDNTEVTINPSNSILLSDETSSSDPVTVVLNKGETYAVASYESYAMFNLAGSTIKSNKPIAVTVNDDSVTPNGGYNADAVGEQLIPTDFAGTSFVIISGGNSYDICTVFALYNNTTVTVSGLGYSSQTFTINKGGYETISMDSRQALSVTSSEPIMVFQTLSAVQGGGELGGTVLPHVKCTGSGVVGYKPFSSEFTSYINLITEKKNISKFTIDGVPVSASNFQAVDADDNYYFAAIPKPYSPTPYVISCADGFFQMGVTEGGYDGSNTYGFFSNYGAAYQGDEYDSFKEGTIYTWLNHYDKKDGYTPLTFTAEGVYRDTLMAEDGCDSVCVLHLTKKMAVPDNVEEVNCSAQLDNNEWTIKASYSSDIIMSPLVIPLVGDINDDGINEILCFAADDGYNFYGVTKVNILNGNTKQIIKSIDIDGVVCTQSAGVYGMIKLPNRHTILVVVTKDKHMLGYDLSSNSNTYIWKRESPYYNPNVSFADFNNDGYPEVYLGNYIYDVETGNLLAHGGDNSGKSNAHGNRDSYYGSEQYLHAPFAADIDNDGFLELVAGNEVYKVKITNRSGESGNSISLYRSITPPSGVPADGHTQVADFNLDGYLDVLVSNKIGNSANVYIYVWDIYNNRTSAVVTIPNYDSGKSMPLIADINADGELEIIIQSCTSDSNVKAYKYNIATNDFTHLWNLWVDEDSYSNTMSAFDFNHDGINELILTDQTTVKIMNGSGKSHLTGKDTINIYAMSSFSFGECTIMQYPVIVDVDKDGSADIIAIGRYGSGHTYIASLNIFTSAGVPWAPARSVWNQYMYNVFNVNEDLTIPTYHYSNAMSFTDPDDPTIIRRPYNNFLQQTTTIDQYGRYVNRAADVAVTSVSQTQTETEWTLTPSYCNNGERDLMAPYQITVYADSYHGEVIATETINESLPVGACAKPTIKIPSGVIEANPSIEQVVIAVNDKGLGVAQRGHQQAECDTTNNTKIVYIQNIQSDTTHFNLVICASELPYTHPETGIVFPVGFSKPDSCETHTNQLGGDSVVQVKITINPTLYGDTTAYICQGEEFTWHGVAYGTAGDYLHTYTSKVTDCDSVVTLHLTVWPSKATTIDVAIPEGYPYVWNDQTYSESGMYIQRFTTDKGCDSVVTLHLTVNPLIYDVVAHDQCADDPYMEFDVTASDGLFQQLQFVFGPKAIAQHFRDTIVAYSSQIQIPNSARAGIYEVAVSPLYNDQVLETRKIPFTLLYPSSVLDQHWDDFIGVLTHNYNGGYDFVGFQWYKDGKPMAGENHSYTYQALEMGAAYSAMLEEADGTRLMTCEIIATPQTEISVYPTLLRPLQIMRLHNTTDVTIWLYDDLGKMTYTNTFAPGDHQLAAPQVPGVYVLRIEQTGTSGKTDTKKLIVR